MHEAASPFECSEYLPGLCAQQTIQGCSPVVEEDYMNSHYEKDDIPHQVKPRDRLRAAGGTEASASNIKTPYQADP